MMEVRDYLLALALLGQLANAAWLYIERRSDKTNERVTTLDELVGELKREVGALQQSAKNAPTHSDLGKVYESINALAATVHQLVGENRGQSDTLRLILNQITQKGMA